MRVSLIVLLSVVLLSAIAGCGGSRRFEIETGADGTLDGVRTVPRDGDYDVPVDIMVRVYWPSGTEPPSTFTFALRDGSDTRIRTYRHDGEQMYEWWFEPADDFDYDTRYKIEISAEDEDVVSYFWTEWESSLSAQTRASDADTPDASEPRVSEPLEEHVIHTR